MLAILVTLSPTHNTYACNHSMCEKCEGMGGLCSEHTLHLPRLIKVIPIPVTPIKIPP
jgi:hypothetical protein